MKPHYKLSLTLFSLTMCIGVVACQPTQSPVTDIETDTTTNSNSPIDSSVNEQSQPISNEDTPTINNDSLIESSEDKSDNTLTAIAPWTEPAIKNGETDTVYQQEWMKSERKSLCPILALPKQASAHLTQHSVRRANFSGGWGVAYDLPDMRSAYGVANVGTTNPNDIFDDWPYNVTYQDGSILGYGHEGSDPSANWLAYIVTPHNNCFYNIWSAQSKEHLEEIISDLRVVSD